MNSYERVMNMLQGQPVDRPPVLAVLGFYGGTLTGTPIEQLYRDPDLYVAAQQAVVDTFGIDMVLPPFELSIIAEAFRGDDAFFGNQAPNMKRPPCANIDEAFMLLPEWMPRWKEILEQELGLNGDTARELFKETRRELVYLDTGVCPVPQAELEACAAYTGLPVRIEPVGLSLLLKVLQHAENESHKKTTSGTC